MRRHVCIFHAKEQREDEWTDDPTKVEEKNARTSWAHRSRVWGFPCLMKEEDRMHASDGKGRRNWSFISSYTARHKKTWHDLAMYIFGLRKSIMAQLPFQLLTQC